MANGKAQNAAHLPVQDAGGLGGNSIGLREGVDPRGEESFVAIDVAQPAQAVLVHQKCFDLPRPSQDLSEARQPNRERVGAQCLERLLGGFLSIPNAAESPRIAKANLAAPVVQPQKKMRVQEQRCIDGQNLDAPSHSQMTDQRIAVAKIQGDPFPVASDRLDGFAAQFLQIGARWKTNVVGMRDANVVDDCAGDLRAQARRDRFDFRELRHLHYWRRTMRPVAASPLASRRRK